MRKNNSNTRHLRNLRHEGDKNIDKEIVLEKKTKQPFFGFEGSKTLLLLAERFL